MSFIAMSNASISMKNNNFVNSVVDSIARPLGPKMPIYVSLVTHHKPLIRSPFGNVLFNYLYNDRKVN